MYLSPPDQLTAQTGAELQALLDAFRYRGASTDAQQNGGAAPIDPFMERYVARLLAMSKTNVDALNVSSSDVSVKSGVARCTSNMCSAQTQTPTTRSPNDGCPNRRSVGVAVSPEQLLGTCTPCAPYTPCAPCASPPDAPTDATLTSGKPFPLSPASAPLDTTEYLQHQLYTRSAFRRVPQSATPADPALPHYSPDYRPLAPLRVGGGAQPPEASTLYCSCDAHAVGEACRTVASDVVKMSERCARRIESLARLIEHVRLEKDKLARPEATVPKENDTSATRESRTPPLVPARSPPPTSPRAHDSGPFQQSPKSVDAEEMPEDWFTRLQQQQQQQYTSPTAAPSPWSSPVGPASSPPRTCISLTCPVSVPVSPPHSPPEEISPKQPARAVPLLDVGDGDPVWVFAPGAWPPAAPQPYSSVSLTAERGRGVLRPKPPPSAWRPGVPYVEQHELSVIPEVDSSLLAEISQQRSPSSTAAPTRTSSKSPLTSVVSGEGARFYTGPRENLHGLLIATHLAAQEVQPWESPGISACSPRVLSPPPGLQSPPAQSPPIQSPRRHIRPPSPLNNSPHRTRTQSPSSRSPSRTPSPRRPSPRTGPSCSHSPLSYCPSTSPPEQPAYEDDPDIVAELMRRGVLRSPFSWMKNAESVGPVDVDLDASVVSGASSDFVGELLKSGSSSTPQKAGPSHSDSSPDHLRQRGGADDPLVAQDVFPPLRSQAPDPAREAVPEDLEGMFKRLGLGWAVSMLRKTQETMAISSSSSETSRGAATRPSGDTNNPLVEDAVNRNAATRSGFAPRRGHSTPAEASAISDGSGSGSVTWQRGLLTGDSDVSSVRDASSRELSTPSVSLVVKSKGKNDSPT